MRIQKKDRKAASSKETGQDEGSGKKKERRKDEDEEQDGKGYSRVKEPSMRKRKTNGEKRDGCRGGGGRYYTSSHSMYAFYYKSHTEQ